MEELRSEDPQSFFNYIRMKPAMFDNLVQIVGPRIEMQDTKMRKALPPGLKLTVTVRFLTSGDKYVVLMYSLIIPEVCQVILEEYTGEVIACPTTPKEWTPIAEVFRKRWFVPYGTCRWRIQVTVDGHRCTWNGSTHIFNESVLKDCLEDRSILFTKPHSIPKDDELMSYCIL